MRRTDSNATAHALTALAILVAIAGVACFAPPPQPQPAPKRAAEQAATIPQIPPAQPAKVEHAPVAVQPEPPDRPSDAQLEQLIQYHRELRLLEREMEAVKEELSRPDQPDSERADSLKRLLKKSQARASELELLIVKAQAAIAGNPDAGVP